MVREFQREVKRPSTDVFIQEVNGVHVRVDLVNPAAAVAVLMSMFRLKDLFNNTVPQHFVLPQFGVHRVRAARPVPFIIVESVVLTESEVEIARDDRQAFVLFLDFADERANA